MTFRDLDEGENVEVDDGAGGKVTVTNARGNHPQGVYAFRVEHAGKVFVYATDTEHYEGRIDDKLLALARGADVFVYDSQYTPEEYGAEEGLGAQHLRGGRADREGRRRRAARPLPPRPDAERRGRAREGSARAQALPERDRRLEGLSIDI